MFGEDLHLLRVSDPITGWNTNRIMDHQKDTNPASFYAYDARGNITAGDGAAYEVDSRNRVVSARMNFGGLEKEKGRYAYDGAAQRLRKEDPERSLHTYYVRDAQGHLVSEFRRPLGGQNLVQTAIPEWTKHYIYAGSRLIALRENRTPPPPAGLQATVSVAGPNGGIHLSWRPGDTGNGITIQKYHVYRSDDVTPPVWTWMAETFTPNYADAVSTGVWYRYVVVAQDPQGHKSYPSGQLVIQASKANPSPSTPANFSVRPGDRSASLTWSANPANENVVGYHVYRGEGSSSAVRLTDTPLRNPGFVDQTGPDGVALRNGTTYRYAVSAMNTVNKESARTAEISATPLDYTRPAPAIGLRAMAACDGTASVRLHWEAGPELTEPEYILFRKHSSTGVVSSTSAGNLTDWVDRDVTEDTEYVYWIQARDLDSNVSEESLHVPVRTRVSAASMPVPPRPFADAGDGRVTVHTLTEDLDPSITSVRFYRKRNVDLDCTNYEYVGSVPVAGAFADLPDNTVPNNAAYDYAASFVDTNNRESALSMPALAMPLGAPYAPTECFEIFGTAAATDFRDGAGVCQLGMPWARVSVRWQQPAATAYTPMTAADTPGLPGYLIGYRLYGHQSRVENPLVDQAALASLQDDHEKYYCQDHPGVACSDDLNCPTGDSCVRDIENGYCAGTKVACSDNTECTLNKYASENQCVREVGTCGGAKPSIGGFNPDPFCYADSDCNPGIRCQYPVQYQRSTDPWLIRNRADGIDTAPEWLRFNGYGGSCLAAKAVYRILADGAWRTVESEFTDNFDALGEDQLTRCAYHSPHVCDLSDFGGTPRCIPDALPAPGPPTVSSPAPGQILVDWDPPMSCQPQSPASCGPTLPCPSGQYCRFTSADGLAGICQFSNPVSCSESNTTCPDPTTQTCQSRDDQIAGYYIYMDERDLSWPGHLPDYDHFRRSVPAASTDAATTSYTFSGIVPWSNKFSFRVASFDGGGKISPSSQPSALAFPQIGPAGTAAPASVKVDPWTAGTISISWAAGGSTTGSLGYRVWRATTPGGPYCVFIPGQQGLECRTPALLTPTDVTTTEGGLADSSAEPTVTYYYAISQMFGGGVESPLSREVGGVAFPLPAQPLRPPEQFQASAPRGKGSDENGRPIPFEYTGVYLSWCRNADSEGVTSYKVYRSLDPHGPYDEDAVIATIPPHCLDGRHRCEIGANRVVTETEAPACIAAPAGTCQVVDTQVEYHSIEDISLIYYYTVTAVRDLGGGMVEESAFAPENQGRPNYSGSSGWTVRYDPDNFPKLPCGEYRASLEHDGMTIARCDDVFSSDAGADTSSALAGCSSTTLAPDPVIGASPSTAATSGSALMAPYRFIGQETCDPATCDPAFCDPVTCEPLVQEVQTTGGPTPCGDCDPGGGGGGGGDLNTPILAVPRFLYYHLDHLGSPRAVTDAAGVVVSKHVYMPFGEEIPLEAQQSSNTRQFTGHERDSETGLDYMLARYYSSSLGRFMAVDPVFTPTKNLGDPQRWNRYTYAGNNPLKYVDPDGQQYVSADARFIASMQRIAQSGSATGLRVMNTFAKNKANPAVGRVVDGARWEIKDSKGRMVNSIYKADGSRPSPSEVASAGGVSATPTAAASTVASGDVEGMSVVYLGSKQYDPTGAGMSDEEWIDKEVVHETTHQNGGSEAEADASAAAFVKERQKKQSQSSPRESFHLAPELVDYTDKSLAEAQRQSWLPPK